MKLGQTFFETLQMIFICLFIVLWVNNSGTFSYFSNKVYALVPPCQDGSNKTHNKDLVENALKLYQN